MTANSESPDQPRRASALTAWLPVVLGVAIAIAALSYVRSHILFDTETAAMGEATSVVFGSDANGRFQCIDHRDFALCEAAYRKAGSPPAVLWLGNSQLHGVNRFHEGDETAAMRLHPALLERGRYLVAFSPPNGNLFEHRLMFNELKRAYDVDTLLLPVCLDDFRETSIRDTLRAPDAAPAQTTKPAEPKNKSVQPVVEAHLESALSRHIPLWEARQGMKGLVQYAIYTGRNRLFGINAQTKRPVSEASYVEKIAVLRALVAEADAAGVKVVLYAPPFRRDIPHPYVEAQYERLLADLKTIAGEHGATFLDLTDKVPGPEWGMMSENLFGGSDYDFMHFTARGHRILADNLAPAL